MADLVQVTLLDSVQKKCAFIDASSTELRLRNVKVVWGRAETAAASKLHRQVWDLLLVALELEIHSLYAGYRSPDE